MEEKVLFSEVRRIVDAGGTLESTIRELRALLAEELGAKVLAIRGPHSKKGLLGSPEISGFLESRDFACRSLCSFNLESSGEHAALKLIACFASDTFQGSLPERVTQFSAERLGQRLVALAGPGASLGERLN